MLNRINWMVLKFASFRDVIWIPFQRIRKAPIKYIDLQIFYCFILKWFLFDPIPNQEVLCNAHKSQMLLK